MDQEPGSRFPHSTSFSRAHMGSTGSRHQSAGASASRCATQVRKDPGPLPGTPAFVSPEKTLTGSVLSVRDEEILYDLAPGGRCG
jgi:hypothetical protein